MKCNWEWLSTYLDGALAEDKRAKLEEHLKTCEACSAKLEEFARVEQTAKKIPAPQLSEAYWENFASRVQNKLAIRERRRTSPNWLETLKSFFQPTTGKLAIAGSVAAIILLTFISLEQWKKQTFRPPVFEAEKPVAEAKVDSVPVPAKDAPAYRTAEKNREIGLVEEKRLDQPTSEKATATLSQKPAENVPAASVSVGRALAAPEEQKSEETPSLAAFGERDEAMKGDTVLVTAGKKAETRKEVASSQQKGTIDGLERLPIRNIEDLLKLQDSAPPPLRIRGRTPSDTLMVKNKVAQYIISDSGVREYSLIKGGFDAQYGGKAMLAIDTVQLVADIQRIIAEKEKQLKRGLAKAETESLYIDLAQYYVQLYRLSLDAEDWKRADKRLSSFLKADLSGSTRRWLVAIQAELKKLKK